MKVEYTPIGLVYEAHIAASKSLEMRIEWEGGFKHIRGEENKVVDVGLVSIEIATSRSTPVCVFLSPAAEGEFRSALESLLKNGEQFYTCLRSNWNIPSFYWRLLS